MRLSQNLVLFIAATALPVFLESTAQAQQLPQEVGPMKRSDQAGEIFIGADYQQGNYGTSSKVETTSTTVGFAARKGRLRVGVAIPYLRTTAPANVVVSQGGLFGTPLFSSSSSRITRTSREGLGDTVLQAAYVMPVAGFAASLGGGVKIPTASRRNGLGTGKIDYAVNVQLERPLRYGITPFGSLVYSFLGQPDGFVIRNTLSGSAGMRVALTAGNSAALFYSYEQSALQSLADRQSIGVGLVSLSS